MQIKLEHLTKRFGDTVAVNDLSITLESGRLIGSAISPRTVAAASEIPRLGTRPGSLPCSARAAAARPQR